jgi:hypothetical protein
MPIQHRPPSSWPAILAAMALFLVGTGAIALHRGWISSKSWRSAQRILLSIRSELSGAGAAAVGEAGNPDGVEGDLVEGDLGRAEEMSGELPADLAAPSRSEIGKPAPAWGRSKSKTPTARATTPPRQPAPPSADPFEERRRRLRERHSGDVVAALAEEEAPGPSGDAGDEPVVERAPGRKPASPAPPVIEDDEAPAPAKGPTGPPRASKPLEGEPASDSSAAPSASSTASPASSSPSKLLDIAAIDQLIDDERDVQALQELTKWYWKTPAKREELRPRLEELSQRIYFSQQPHYFEPHVIANNEQLRTIAREYELTWEYLARLNRTDPRRIRPGQKLKVVPGPFHVLVNVRSHELIVHNNGCFVKRYVIGAGKDRSTPVGVFPVKNKLVNPTYYPPEGGIVKADDPANPLGTRWIDIGDSFGIHGTNEPDTVGKDLSRGCVRMRNDDVAEVYDFLVIGSEVRIQR